MLINDDPKRKKWLYEMQDDFIKVRFYKRAFMAVFGFVVSLALLIAVISNLNGKI